MKHNVTQLEDKNEPVNSVLGNYFIELEPWNYQAEEASGTPDTQPDLLRFSRADEIDCKIVDLVSDVVFDSSTVEVDGFWTLFLMDLKLCKDQELAVSRLIQRKINIFFHVD